jgi:hypothetical protein
MESKETIKLFMSRELASKSDILVCKPSSNLLIDNSFYTKVMREAPPSKKRALTYATKITSVRADWIINEKEGYKFLIELQRQQNKSIFTTPYI